MEGNRTFGAPPSLWEGEKVRREKRPSNKSHNEPNYYSHTRLTEDGQKFKIKYNHHSENHNEHSKPVRDDFSEIEHIKNISIENIGEEFTWTRRN